MADETIRIAQFNASLNRGSAGQLVTDLSTPGNAQARTVAEIIQRAAPDILLINEFDYVPNGQALDLFRDNYLEVGQNTLGLADGGGAPIDFQYAYTAPSNTGIPSGFDLDNNGSVGGPNDALGFGFFPGQFGMAFFSEYEILTDQVRTFQTFLWQDMPGARLPDDPNTAAPADWYSPEELAVFRLSSKSHWDIPVLIEGEVVHFILAHPTPPVFDGPEDRNGTRNADEIRFIADYVTPGAGDYIYDDEGTFGGLEAGARFVIMGDMNADPNDGDSLDVAVNQLLDNPLVDGRVVPDAPGGAQQAALQGGANANHIGLPQQDTADFADGAPGNLRADYVLPSQAGLTPVDGAIFWPLNTDPTFPLVGTFTPSLPGGFPSSDHRLVSLDVQVDPLFPTLTGDAPEVIAHRGASADRPEHTLEAYRLAIELGADVIEPDLVVTKDGVLIARHEPLLGGTTDVADRPEFADRRTTKVLEGETITDWWAEDFTLAEIKTLRAVERIPGVRPDNAAFDGLYEIPTLAEIIALVKEIEAATGRQIAIIPETKHPTYFEYNGVYQDGTRIGVDTSRLLIDTLVEEDFTDPQRVSIQSFEIANLIELQTEIMPEADIDLPLVQLLYNNYSPDLAFHFGSDPLADPSLYDGFDFPLDATTVAQTDGAGLYSAAAFQAMADLYAEAISPFKEDVFASVTVPPVDLDGDGVPRIGRQLTGDVLPIVQRAHDAGLEAIVYTLRDEEPFLARNPDGSIQRPVEEYVKIIKAGFDGFFTDSPATGRAVVDQLRAEEGAVAAANAQGGNDILVFDAVALTATKGSAGRDTAIYAFGGTLTLAAGIEDAELRGSLGATVEGNGLSNRIAGRDGSDELRGRRGDDSLDGGAAADRLRGGLGEDRLTGGAGVDRLFGGDGADAFVFARPSEGGDRIGDFEAGEDRILVSAAGFGGGLAVGALDTDRFAEVAGPGLPAGTAPAGTGQFLFAADRGLLWWDADGAGAGAATLLARLPGATVAAEDIVVIA